MTDHYIIYNGCLAIIALAICLGHSWYNWLARPDICIPQQSMSQHMCTETTLQPLQDEQNISL